jgi:hypothetical protein
VSLFPNQINISNVEPLDFVAVGVGPLSHNKDYVDVGEPSDNVRNDMKFLATHQRVKYPLLPVSTTAEYGIIKEFCLKYPRPKTPDIQCLCKMFKVSANGVDIFCKVPTISNLQLTNGKSINSGSF